MLLKLFSPSFLYKHIIKDNYDVVVSYLEGQSARIVAGCCNPNTKKIAWIHCTFTSLKEVAYSFRNKYEAIECYNSFNAVAYVSKNVKEAFVSQVPGLKNNQVIYNVNDDNRIRIMSQEQVDDVVFSNEINVITSGRLIPLKGYERLIEVHSRLIKDGIRHHVYIVGGGVLQEKLENKIFELGLTDTFHILGFKNNPYKYIAKADLYVCSSLSEGFSTSVSESLILGKAVLSTNVSGAKEQLGDNNEYGFVVDNSLDGIYVGLKKLLTNIMLIDHYKTVARERGKIFSKECAVNSACELIDSL